MKHRLVAVMQRKHRLLAAIAAALFVGTAGAAPARPDVPRVKTFGAGLAARAATLNHDPQFILEAVARRMGVTPRREVPLPAIRLESRTQLRRMQVAADQQWGFRPPVFLSTYAAASNEIFLIDEAALYANSPRTLDDALAHEFVHYFQAKYRKDRSDSEWSEIEAMAIQAWFRNEIMAPRRVALEAQHAATQR